MSAAPVGTTVELRIPRPVASSKNRRRVFARGRRTVSLLSEQATADVALVRHLAAQATGGVMPFDKDDALRLEYDHKLGTDDLVVRVVKVGTLPPPGRKRGTRRDLHGMMDTLADALQGVLYPDDRQIDEAACRRRRGS